MTTINQLIARTAPLALLATTLLLAPLSGTAHAASPLTQLIPAPEGCSAAPVLDVDDLLAVRKAGWSQDRAARHLF